MLGIPQTLACKLKARVSDFIVNGRWSVPRQFQVAFSDIARRIAAVSFYSKGDVLIWTPSVTREISFKDIYEVCRSHGPHFNWLTCIWQTFIPPRRSIHMVRLVRNKLATDVNIRKCGIVITSCCCMCMQAEESIVHLFLTCPFARAIWHWLVDKFQLSIIVDRGVVDFFNMIFHLHMSPQVKELWLAAVTTVMWGLWQQRNASRFEDKLPNYNRLCYAIVGWVREAAMVVKGVMFNNVHDLVVIKIWGVKCVPRKAPKIVEVKWYPPLQGWVKCNIDGLYNDSSNQAACGGLFRDYKGSVLGVFVQKLGTKSAFFTEFFAVLLTVEMAFQKGWRCLWLEMDSAITFQTFFNKSYSPLADSSTLGALLGANGFHGN